jgi:hypothetical protein
MFPQTTMQQILADLPWGKNVRILVGPLASRDLLRDTISENLLQHRPPSALTELGVTLPGRIVADIPSYAAEVLRRMRRQVPAVMSPETRVDFVMALSSSRVFRQRAPQFALQLKRRAVAKKIARFLEAIHLSFIDEANLSALCDLICERFPDRAVLLDLVLRLWTQMESEPGAEYFSSGAVLRAAIRALGEAERAELLGLPQVHLWGYEKLNSLEAAFLTAFSKPVQMLELPSKLSANPKVWRAHSALDEFEFFYDECARLRAEGVPANRIAVALPDDEAYLAWFQHQLERRAKHDSGGSGTMAGEWEPTLSLLQCLSSGCLSADVEAMLTPALPNTLEALKRLREGGFYGGQARLTRILSGMPELPEPISALVSLAPALSRAKSWAETAQSVEHLSARYPRYRKLHELCEHVHKNRSYLALLRPKPSLLLSLAQEMATQQTSVETKAERLLSKFGFCEVTHGTWLPFEPTAIFVLQAHRTLESVHEGDPWDLDGILAQHAQAQLGATEELGAPQSQRQPNDGLGKRLHLFGRLHLPKAR